MKNWIIKLFGGYTKKEYDSIPVVDRKHLFRKGDVVYINKRGYNPSKPFFLLESYNGSTCWYVSQSVNDTTRRWIENGVHIDQMTHDKIPTCPCCNQSI